MCGQTDAAADVLSRVDATQLSEELVTVHAYTAALVAELQGDTEVAKRGYESVVKTSGDTWSVVWASARIRQAFMAEKEAQDSSAVLALYEPPMDAEGKLPLSDGIDLLILAKGQYLSRSGDAEAAAKTVATVGALKHDHYTNDFLGDLFLTRAVVAGNNGTSRRVFLLAFWKDITMCKLTIKIESPWI